MSKYSSLIKNTTVFAIGTFSSKLLVFVLMPIYTHNLTTEQYGTVDLIIQAANLLYPVVSLGITAATVRFGVDRSNNRKEIFTLSYLTFFIGFALFILASPLLLLIEGFNQYLFLFLIYLFTSSINYIIMACVRAKGSTKLYSINGFLNTCLTCSSTIVFLPVLHFGIEGYLLAIIISDCLSSLFMLFISDMHKFISLKVLKIGTWLSMLKYSLPLVPTQILWWVVSISDRYMIAFMISSSANGLYAASIKIPSIIMLVSSIFMEAWAISSVREKDSEYLEHFFTTVFNIFSGVVFLASSLIIPFSKVFSIVLVSAEFYESWKYIPFLVLANAFCALVNFQGTIYSIEKKSGMVLITTLIGAIVNIGLNIVLINLWGTQGAAISTAFSYFLVFVIRAFHTRTIIKIKLKVLKLIINIILITGQCVVMIFEPELWILYVSAIAALLVLLNFRDVVLTIKRRHPTKALKASK